jgi:hypothetical protein
MASQQLKHLMAKPTAKPFANPITKLTAKPIAELFTNLVLNCRLSYMRCSMKPTTCTTS